MSEIEKPYLGPKQVIVLRKDLNMRKGKMVAQGAHASLAPILDAGHWSGKPGEFVISCDPEMEAWIRGSFKKITCYVNTEADLLEIHRQAVEAKLNTSLILDSGLTEFGGVPTYTAVSVGPNDPAKIDEITGRLPLL